MPEDRRKGTAFERHSQTGLTLLGVALLVWVGSTTQSTQIKLAELAVEVNNMKDIVRAPQANLDNLTARVKALETRCEREFDD